MIPGTGVPMSAVIQEFPSKSNEGHYHYVYRTDEIMCSCPGFEHVGRCWHMDKVLGRMRIEELRKKLNEGRVKKHGSVFEDMIPVREATYKELERRRRACQG